MARQRQKSLLTALLGCTLLVLIILEPVFALKKCGTRNFKPRIHNGQRASKNEFPWHVLLEHSAKNGIFYCGAAIISDEWIITTAICVSNVWAEPYPTKSISILMGTVNSTVGPNQKFVGIKQIVMHPKYSNKSTENDLALVKLAEPIGLEHSGDNINAICLGRKEDVVPGREVVVTGWGEMENHLYPTILRKGTINVVGLEECRKAQKPVPIYDGQICATSRIDPCLRDSGGPLQYSNKDGRWYLMGLIVWGHSGCGNELYPSVYTRVPYYLDFIRKVTNIPEL